MCMQKERGVRTSFNLKRGSIGVFDFYVALSEVAL